MKNLILGIVTTGIILAGCARGVHEYESPPLSQNPNIEQSMKLFITLGKEQIQQFQQILTQLNVEQNKEREKAHAECKVTAQTSFAVFLANIFSVFDVFPDNKEKLIILPTTKLVVDNCMKSKGMAVTK